MPQTPQTVTVGKSSPRTRNNYRIEPLPPRGRYDPAEGPAGELLDLALFLAEHGEVEASLEWLNRAEVLDPDNPTVYYRRSLVHGYLNRPDLALADADRSAQLDPECGDAYFSRGIANVTLGRLDAAEADFTRVIEMAPLEPLPYANRGATRAAAGRHEEAVADFDEALRRDPSLTQVREARSASQRHVEELSAASDGAA